MHTEGQHICLVGTETTKVPALDLYKNSKSKNKNLLFFPGPPAFYKKTEERVNSEKNILNSKKIYPFFNYEKS